MGKMGICQKRKEGMDAEQASSDINYTGYALGELTGLANGMNLGEDGSRRVLTMLASAVEVGDFAKMGKTIKKLRFEDNQGFSFHKLM